MAQTLFQRLTRGKEVVEFNYFNPAKARIGAAFQLDLIGLRGMIFILKEIRQYERTINGKTLTFGDYYLQSRPVDSEEQNVIVRFVPNAVGATTHDVLLLRVYDEMQFNKELDGALRCGSGQLEITQDGQTETYWRPQAGWKYLTEPYQATVTKIQDLNGDGRIDANEAISWRIEFWDYSRETKMDGQDVTQFLFVEFLKDDAIQVMLRGERVPAERISVL